MRTIEVYESAYNAKKLSENHWNFQIAKSVSTGTTLQKPNVVWQSKAVAPRTIIQWKDQYALNWTSSLPDPGVSVTISGEWQACNLGEVFDIDSTGFWSASTAPKEDNFMKVGKVNYQYPGADGLHIVVGIQNSDGSFDPIFVDPISLILNSTASYQPQETIRWWYQSDMRTATMISNAHTSLGTVDFSNPAPATSRFFYSTTFNYQSGQWITSEDSPPETLYAPPLALVALQSAPSQLFSIWSSIWQGVLSATLTKTQAATATATLKSLLAVRYKDVEVRIIEDLKVNIKLGTPLQAKQNSNDAIGAPNDDIRAEISNCFQYLKNENIIPAGETWVINKVLAY